MIEGACAGASDGRSCERLVPDLEELHVTQEVPITVAEGHRAGLGRKPRREAFAERQHAPAGARLRLDDHNFVPCLVELPGGRQPREASAQDDHPLFRSRGREGTSPRQYKACRCDCTALKKSTTVHEI